jgi:HEAT repeat protein
MRKLLNHAEYEVADSLWAQLETAQGHDIRSALRKRLIKLGEASTDTLLRGLESSRDLSRWEAVNLLGVLVPVSATEATVRFALAEDEIHARWRAAWAVCRFDRTVTTPLLLDALGGRNATRRWRAALILSMMGRQEATPAILEGLDAPDDWTRWEALSAVKALRIQDGVEHVGAFLAPDTSRHLRQEAVLALGHMKSERATKLLRDALSDPCDQIRWRASMVLIRRGALARPWLERQLKAEKDPGVVRQLKYDLARLQEEEN